MYCIQSVPITNSSLAQDSESSLHDEIKSRLSRNWLSSQQNCDHYDMIGRKLVQKSKGSMHSTSSDYKGGFDRLRCHLARIDAHLFTYFVCSFLIAAPSDDQPEYSIECRECRKSLSTGSEPKTPEPFVFALHTVALEGSNRFYSNLLDFVCLDCAIHICRSKVAFYDRKSADNAADKKRWQLSLRALLKLLSQKGTCCKVGLREMLRLLCILSNGNIGFEICHFQELLDLYVQERFASEQLGLWQETNLNTKSRRAPINRQHCFLDRQQVIDNLRCAYCQSDVSRLPNTQVGMVSTIDRKS